MKLNNYFKPSNWYYWLIGNIRKRLYKSQEANILKVTKRAIECPECWKKGECINCGCETYAMFLSDKPCKNDKL